MSLREDILVQRNAIGRDDLALLIEHVRQARTTDSLVSNFEDPQDSGTTEWVVNRNIRDTQEVHLPASITEKLVGIDRANVTAFINPFYTVEVRDSEPLQVLHYGIGGHYIPHVDAETLYKDDAGLEMWEKTLDRDLSVVYFLNDDFEGGELVFPGLDLVIEPEAGTLVCFPSDHNFIHGVNPVTAGDRYTVVTWMRIKGMPAPDEINQMAMDEYHRRWPKQIEQRPRVARGRLAQRCSVALESLSRPNATCLQARVRTYESRNRR
jgi:predicted 2-oxoglutarate/Fe(II)-dependent dioxygenase YbiX